MRAMVAAKNLLVNGGENQIQRDRSQQPRWLQELFSEGEIQQQKSCRDYSKLDVANANVEAVLGGGESFVTGEPFGVFGVRVEHAASFTLCCAPSVRHDALVTTCWAQTSGEDMSLPQRRVCASLFADIFVPHRGICGDVISEWPNAFGGVQVDDRHTVFT